MIQQKIFKPLGISLGLKAQQPKSSRLVDIIQFFLYMTRVRNDSAILDAQRDGTTDSVAIAKKTGLEVQSHHSNDKTLIVRL